MTRDVSSPEEIRLLDGLEARVYADLFEAAPAEIARPLGVAVIRCAGAVVLRTARIPSPMFNRAIGLGVQAPATEDDLDAVLAELRGTTFYLTLSPIARPAELDAWIAGRGLVPAARPLWAKVVRGSEAPPVVDTPLAVRELGSDDAAAFGQVATSAFDMPPSVAPWLAALVGRPRWRVFGAFDGRQLVAGGALRVSGTDAWLGVGGTLPSHRRQHAQRAVMARRVAAAIDEGCTTITCETGEPHDGERNPSLENMFACGFRRAYSRRNFGPPSPQ